MAALGALLERAIGGRGGVVNVVGPPGIGKSRMAREAAAAAAGRGVEVIWGFKLLRGLCKQSTVRYVTLEELATVSGPRLPVAGPA